MVNINEQLGKIHKNNTCYICKSQMPYKDLNYEAKIHHNADYLECINRKECNKRKKKLLRKKK